ncbi:hypothetical protein R9X47_09555 [Wukongibacter baidiensis]|uniref:hypothetical protein n=1 Tax=Wukongibacter baidiensis TaxID=1723361 RepID=UPI003D7F827A
MKNLVIKVIINLLICTLIFSGCTNNKITSNEEKRIVEDTSSTNSDGQNDFIMEEKEHFIYYFTLQDKDSITEIDKTLENNYKKVVNDLKPDNLPKIKIRIYPGLKTFHKGMGWSNYPDWAVGTAYGVDEVRIVSPNNPGPAHSYDAILQVAVHEFTHVVTNNISSFAYKNTWLWESIALYEANQFKNPKEIKDLKTDKYQKFTEIRDSIQRPEIYEIGYTIIEYIKYEWNMETVRNLIKNNGNVEKVVGITPNELEKGWYEYISKKYLE